MKDKNDFIILLDDGKTKIEKALFLVQASLKKLESYDVTKDYTPDELEPYDALADRFIRCVEVFVRFFKTYDRYQSVEISLSYRDLINFMHKLGLISNVQLWLQMRDVRNKIVHDHLPEQTKYLFDSIMGDFYKEILFTSEKVKQLTYK